MPYESITKSEYEKVGGEMIKINMLSKRGFVFQAISGISKVNFKMKSNNSPEVELQTHFPPI